MKPRVLNAFARYDIVRVGLNAKQVSEKYKRSPRWGRERVREVKATDYTIEGDERAIEAHRVESLSSIDDGDNQDRDMETNPWSVSDPVSKSRDSFGKLDGKLSGPAETEVLKNFDEHDQWQIDDGPSATDSTNDRLGVASSSIESPEYNETTNVDSTSIVEQDQPKNNGPEKSSNDDEPKSLKTVATEFLNSKPKSEIDWSKDVTEEDVIPPYTETDIKFNTDILNASLVEKRRHISTFEEIGTATEKGETYSSKPKKKVDEYSEEDVKFVEDNKEWPEWPHTPQSPWLLSFTSKASAVIVALVAGIASYIHIVSVALQSGEDYFVAHIIPFSLDGLIIVATMAMLEDKRNGQKPRIVARAALIVGIIGTLAANVASAGAGLPAEAVAVIPAVAFLLSVEVLVSGGKKVS